MPTPTPEPAVFITPAGKRVVFTDPQEGMRAYAAAGFRGQLYAQSKVPAEHASAPEVSRFLAELGIADAPAPYVAGAQRDPGAAFRLSRVRHEALPDLVDACKVVAEEVKAEDRRDVVVPVRELRLADDGQLIIPGEGRLPLERRGFRQLLSRAGSAVFPRGYDLMMAMAPDLRAYVFQRQLADAGVPKERAVRLRTRRGPAGLRTVFASLSQRYAVHDAPEVLRDVCRALLGTPYRAEVIYRPDTSHLRVDVTAHADTAAAGDVFKLGYRVTSNDAGQGSITFSPVAFRCLCLNMSILRVKRGEIVRWQHRGAVADRASLRRMVARAEPAFTRFTSAWCVLRRTPVSEVELSGQRFDDVGAALEWMVEAGQIKAPIRDAALVEALFTGWRVEGGQTLADLVNAVTRTAHETRALDDDARTAMEERAGELVPVLLRAAR